VFFATLAFAFAEPFFFIGYLISIALFGLYQAIFMANAGGAWDNAKKIVETELKQKGTPLHDATVVGDTVGDPFKDTSSVALNPIIKFTTLFGLLAVELARSRLGRMKFSASLLFVSWLGMASVAGAATPDLLGPEFRSPAYGIALRPPVNCDTAVTGADQIAEFDDDKNHWTLKIMRRSFPQPTPLSDYHDQFGQSHEGLMTLTVRQLRNEQLLKVVAEDVIHIGQGGKTAVGILAMRYDLDLEHRLRQEALIAANDQLYYVLELDTPGRQGADNGTEDPGERHAADAFNQMLDSVQLLDRRAIYRDQADRLIRTAGLLANMTPSYVQDRLIPEQYLLLQRDGRNVGYTYEVEETDDKAGRIAGTPVFRIDMRSVTTPRDGTDLQVQTRLTVTTDRKHELWENLAMVNVKPTAQNKTGTQTLFTEVGSSVQQVKVTAAPPGSGLEAPQAPAEQSPDLAGQPGLRMIPVWTLTVVRNESDAQNPDIKQDFPKFTQDLPVFYLPEALSHLLPRLVPYDEPKTYLFAVYVPDGDHGNPAVMMRYLDVLPAETVRLNGQTVLAVAIKDHVGLEGPTTTHYLSAESGRYLGSVTSVVGADGISSTEMVLPTDAAALRRIWPDCNLTRPDRIVDRAGVQ
jgi:hypothetical protein